MFLFLFLACSASDEPRDTSTDDPSDLFPNSSDTDMDTDTDTDDTDTDTNGGPTSDAAFFASGTYDDVPFEVDCYFDETDEAWSSSLQCQENIQFFMTCRPDDAYAYTDIGVDLFQVWFYLHGDAAAVGTHDVVGLNTIQVGNGMAAPLGSSSDNIVSATVTVDDINLWTSASGSFTATWDQTGDQWAGDHWAQINGTFDFTCP